MGNKTAWERSKANFVKNANAAGSGIANGLAGAYNGITGGNGAMGLIPGYNQQIQYDEYIAPSINNAMNAVSKAGTRGTPAPDENGIYHEPVLPPVNSPGVADPLGDIMRGVDDGAWKYAQPGGLAQPSVEFAGAQAPTQLNLPVIDEHTNAYGAADSELTKAVSNTPASKPKGKKAKNKQKAIRSNITKQTNKQQAAINASAGGASFATVDPFNIFGNKNGANPFNPANKGQNRFSGGAVAGGSSMTPEQSQILDLF